MTHIHMMTLQEFEKIALTGTAEGVNFLLGNLNMNQPFTICKKIDHALSLVVSEEGEARIRFYLFHGTNQMQRNYAALYFKRRGAIPLLKEAVKRGCIDEIQAFSR